MAVLSAELKNLLVRTKLSVLPEDYLVIRLPLNSKPIPGEWYRPATTRFAVFIKESQETSLIVSRRKWLRMQSIFVKSVVSEPMKVIAFDFKLSAAVSGHMSAIGGVLADANINVLPVSTLSSNHILVKKADLPRAVRLLRHLIQRCKS